MNIHEIQRENIFEIIKTVQYYFICKIHDTMVKITYMCWHNTAYSYIDLGPK